MTDHTPDALASALPAGIVFDFPQGDQWGAREIAEFQAEELAESGYVLLHPEYVDEATIERLAEAHWRAKWGLKYADWNREPDGARDLYRRDVRNILAALAGTSAQARHTDGDATEGA